MVTILLVVLLVIAITMIATVLIQRSEGGALGIGGQTGGLVSARGSANLLTRATAVLAFLFIAVCLILAVLTGNQRQVTSVVEGEDAPPVAAEPSGPVLPESAGELLIIPDYEPAQTPMDEPSPTSTPTPSIPDAGDGYLVIPDDSTDSWDPDAIESPAGSDLPANNAVPSLPDVDLPGVPDSAGEALGGIASEVPNPAESGEQPAAPTLPSAD